MGIFANIVLVHIGGTRETEHMKHARSQTYVARYVLRRCAWTVAAT